MKIKEIWTFAKKSVSAWIDDYAPSMGAALAYYTLFSIAPLLVIVIAVAGLVFGQEAAQGQIVGQLRGLLGDEGAIAIEGLLKSVSEPAHGVIATVVGAITLVIGATTVFAELQSALDRIWRSPAAPETSGIWGLLRARLLSFGLVLGLGFVMFVSLVLSAAIAALGKWWGGLFGGWAVLLPCSISSSLSPSSRSSLPQSTSSCLGRRSPGMMSGLARQSRRSSSLSESFSSVNIWAGAELHRASAPRVRSWFFWFGSITRRRFFFSVPSSPGYMHTITALESARPHRPPRRLAAALGESRGRAAATLHRRLASQVPRARAARHFVRVHSPW